MSRRTLAIAGLALVAVVLAVAFGLRARAGEDGTPLGELRPHIPTGPIVEEVAEVWARAWETTDVETMQALVAAGMGAEVAERVTSFRDGLRLTALRATPRQPVVDGDRAIVELDVEADLRALGTWSFTTTVPLVLPAEAPTLLDWRVAWSRDLLHPALVGERRLAVARTMPERGSLLAADGSPLAGTLVGRVGTVDEDGEHRLAGDPAGVSGLQAAFDLELGGRASGEVQVVEGDAVVEVVGRIEGTPGVDVRASIDPRIQSVAEAQLATVPNAAAAVAIRPSTGEVVAVAFNPPGGFNRALNGRYPPGSTFKVVTSTALLLDGITPDSPASCPEVATVNGREFRNAEGAALGDIPFRRAFYESCNTAFVQLAAGLEPAAMVAAAESYGFNQPPGLEVPAETPSFPEPSGLIDQVSAAMGQGRVLVTPLQMARVAATVASGTLRVPTLRAGAPPAAGAPLPDGVAPTLRELMRLVVAEGTGTAARLPDPPVHGKTGTAEFGTARPPRVHAWFIGFRADLAVAVVVEDADGFGGTIAAPLARELLRLAT